MAKTLQTRERKLVTFHSECRPFSQYLYGNEQVLYAPAFPRCWYATKHQKISHRALWQGKLRILMLSLEVCKRILGNNDNEEVKMIREYLYLLATLQIECENNVENQILD